MANSKYYYNTQTCQYERVRPTFWGVANQIISILLMGALIFGAMILVSDHFSESEEEHALRQENNALKKHRTILTSQLTAVEASLATLRAQDKLLYEKLFDIKTEGFNEEEMSKKKTADGNHDILLSGDAVFSEKLKEVTATTERLRKKTVLGNALFGDHFNINQNDAVALLSVPTLRPVPDSSLVRLVSGFGTRINPFHKGKYLHDGVDFTAPRGTSVMATAPGRITAAKQSSLQAGYGTYITIDHGNGFVTQYTHLDDINVRQGDRVTKGQIIGTVGSSGGSIAPHLHYEIIQDGEHVDPMIFMIEGLTSLEYNELLSASLEPNQSMD